MKGQKRPERPGIGSLRLAGVSMVGCLLAVVLVKGLLAQDVAAIRGAIVRITGTRTLDGARVRGSGFVVGRRVMRWSW